MLGDAKNEDTARDEYRRIGDVTKGQLSEIRAKPIADGDASTTAGSYTVAAGQSATRILWCAGASAGSCTITLPDTTAIAITIPADSGWFGLPFAPGELPATTTIVFVDVASNAVLYT